MVYASNLRWVTAYVDSFMNAEENLFEKDQTFCFHRLAFVKYFRHIFHVLGVISVDLM